MYSVQPDTKQVGGVLPSQSLGLVLNRSSPHEPLIAMNTISNIRRKIINKREYAQRAQTSAEHGNPEDPDFGLWTPGSEA